MIGVLTQIATGYLQNTNHNRNNFSQLAGFPDVTVDSPASDPESTRLEIWRRHWQKWQVFLHFLQHLRTPRAFAVGHIASTFPSPSLIITHCSFDDIASTVFHSVIKLFVISSQIDTRIAVPLAFKLVSCFPLPSFSTFFFLPLFLSFV